MLSPFQRRSGAFYFLNNFANNFQANRLCISVCARYNTCMNTQSVIDLVRETRAMMLPYFGNVDIKHFKSENQKDAVTQIDQDVEVFLKERLAEIEPDIGFVGEEFGGDRSAERFWLIDPIDGTGCYIRGLPHCTTMLALIDHGVVTFSIIYDFVRDELYHAVRGGGAFCNSERIHVSDRPLARSCLSCETNLKKSKNLELWLAIRKYASTVHFLSAGYNYILVAAGKTEAHIVYDGFGKDYDFAPGSLLVSEAGGVVTNIGSSTYDYTNCNLVAANPHVHNELMHDETIGAWLNSPILRA